MNAPPDALSSFLTPADRASLAFSPYRVFSREQWAKLRADTPMTLVPRDLEQLSGLIEELSIEEVEQIYLPLSRLLNLHVAAAQELHAVTSRFLGRRERHVPYILGIAGSVAVGKSTTARVLRALLARWADHPRVDLITTDGFLHPNAELERRGLMDRKGFPESFDTARLLNFLHDVKSGRENVEAPVYSHFHYDIMPGQTTVVDRPDILIVEGLNVLQPARLPKDGEAIPFVSDFFNFSIYMDAEPKLIEDWYVTRFLRLRADRFPRPGRLLPPLRPSHARQRATRPSRSGAPSTKRIWSKIFCRPGMEARGWILRKGRKITVSRTVRAACGYLTSPEGPKSKSVNQAIPAWLRQLPASFSTSGRAPIWEMISAAARLPSRPRGLRDLALGDAEQEARRVEVAGAGGVHHLGDGCGRNRDLLALAQDHAALLGAGERGELGVRRRLRAPPPRTSWSGTAR